MHDISHWVAMTYFNKSIRVRIQVNAFFVLGYYNPQHEMRFEGRLKSFHLEFQNQNHLIFFFSQIKKAKSL